MVDQGLVGYSLVNNLAHYRWFHYADKNFTPHASSGCGSTVGRRCHRPCGRIQLLLSFMLREDGMWEPEVWISMPSAFDAVRARTAIYS